MGAMCYLLKNYEKRIPSYLVLTFVTDTENFSILFNQNTFSIDRPENHPNTELCSVYYAPLNFRDIMLASGKLPPDALPGDLAGQVSLSASAF